ncbi:hypothetical protein J1614_011781 [Plenodomus biglobosus]|nr:hypothetical protein J1614_011781 [Plenodomus biglobosus]
MLKSGVEQDAQVGARGWSPMASPGDDSVSTSAAKPRVSHDPGHDQTLKTTVSHGARSLGLLTSADAVAGARFSRTPATLQPQASQTHPTHLFCSQLARELCLKSHAMTRSSQRQSDASPPIVIGPVNHSHRLDPTSRHHTIDFPWPREFYSAFQSIGPWPSCLAKTHIRS